jgi:hypothetical protein
VTGYSEVVGSVDNKAFHSLSAMAIFFQAFMLSFAVVSPSCYFRAYSDCSDGSFMKHAALGFRVHSGWTSLVAISLEGLPAGPFA